MLFLIQVARRVSQKGRIYAPLAVMAGRRRTEQFALADSPTSVAMSVAVRSEFPETWLWTDAYIR